MIVKDHNGKNVLIVTHSANARIVNYCFNGQPRDYDFRKSVINAAGYPHLNIDESKLLNPQESRLASEKR